MNSNRFVFGIVGGLILTTTGCGNNDMSRMTGSDRHLREIENHMYIKVEMYVEASPKAKEVAKKALIDGKITINEFGEIKQAFETDVLNRRKKRILE